MIQNSTLSQIQEDKRTDFSWKLQDPTYRAGPCPSANGQILQLHQLQWCDPKRGFATLAMPQCQVGHTKPDSIFTRRIALNCQVAQLERICCNPIQPSEIETKTLGTKLCRAHTIFWCRWDWLANADNKGTVSVAMKNSFAWHVYLAGSLVPAHLPKYKIVGMHILQICFLVDWLSRPPRFGLVATWGDCR